MSIIRSLFLAALLAASSSAMAEANGRLMPDSKEEFTSLVSDLKKAKVEVYKETTEARSIICRLNTTLQAYFHPLDDSTAQLVMCLIGTQPTTDEEFAFIFKHEVAHAIQWCKGGKVSGKYVSILAQKSHTAIMRTIIAGYSREDWESEADANSFAEITTFESARKLLKKECKIPLDKP